MNFIPLASSSKGNAYLVESGETRLLLECGLPFKKLQRLSGFGLSEISACFITHEHKDHAKCAEKLMERGVPVYASHGTADALTPITGFHVLKRIMPESPNYEVCHIGSLEVLPFMTLHDCREPVGFLVRDKADKLLFATDTVSLGYAFHSITIAAIECNHDDTILSGIGKVPYRQRAHIIRASNTHMSVGRCCDFMRKMDKSKLREVYLLHMSDSNGCPEYFRERVQSIVSNAVRVTVCPA